MTTAEILARPASGANGAENHIGTAAADQAAALAELTFWTREIALQISRVADGYAIPHPASPPPAEQQKQGTATATDANVAEPTGQRFSPRLTA